jgi:hypothetical protein
MATLFKKNFMKVPSITFFKSFNEIGRNAFVDWLLILILNAIVVTTLISGGVYLYLQISTGKFVGSASQDKVDTTLFDQKGLDGITDSLGNKKQNVLEMKNGYAETVDPSL